MRVEIDQAGNPFHSQHLPVDLNHFVPCTNNGPVVDNNSYDKYNSQSKRALHLRLSPIVYFLLAHLC